MVLVTLQNPACLTGTWNILAVWAIPGFCECEQCLKFAFCHTDVRWCQASPEPWEYYGFPESGLGPGSDSSPPLARQASLVGHSLDITGTQVLSHIYETTRKQSQHAMQLGSLVPGFQYLSFL